MSSWADLSSNAQEIRSWLAIIDYQIWACVQDFSWQHIKMLRRSEAGDLQFHLLWVRARSKYKSSWHFPNILCQIYEEQFQNKFKWNWIVPIECVSNEEKVRIQKELTSDNFCQLLFINNIEQERKENTPGGQMSMKISQIDIFKTDICKTNLTSPPWASSEASWLRPSCLLHPGTHPSDTQI